MHPSEVTTTLFKHLEFRANKNKVIAGNIANLNTPNYKTRNLVFQEELQKAGDAKLQIQATNDKHFLLQVDPPKPNQRVIMVEGLKEQNDGNNVNIDSQMSEMSKNNILFQAIQASIKKDSQLFRLVVDASNKN
jgi:flagellar basal-body rod protein FlgB